ncbi:hypothetical protein AW899_15735 [Pseudomonas aeruginosa]|nr:hypothetical protein AW899_15735 [Pseudomonas aeruginosa]
MQHQVNATIRSIAALFDNCISLAAEGLSDQQLELAPANAFDYLPRLSRVRRVCMQLLAFCPSNQRTNGS